MIQKKRKGPCGKHPARAFSATPNPKDQMKYAFSGAKPLKFTAEYDVV